MSGAAGFFNERRWEGMPVANKVVLIILDFLLWETPKIIFASLFKSAEMVFDILLTSESPRSFGPEMFNKIPLAPLML